MNARIVRFIASADAALPPDPGVEQIVLDTTWTSGVDDRSDVRGARPLISAVLRVHQPLADAMRLLDEWAARAGLVERLEVDGVSHWYRRRIAYWRWLHDRLIWRWLLAGLAEAGPIARIQLTADEPELGQIASLVAAREGWQLEVPPVAAPAAAPPRVRLPWPLDPILWRLGLHPGRPGGSGSRVRGASLTARTAAMAARAGGLGREGRRLLVLTDPAVHQAVTTAGATARVDPFLGPVIASLHDTRLEPVVLEIGANTADDRTWEELQAPGRERVLPGSILAEAYADPADELRAAAGARTVADRLAGSFPPLDVDGLDLGPTIVDELRAFAGRGLVSELRQEARIGRLLSALRPEAVLMINEYSRPEWIAAARKQGIAIAAVQHGIIHPLHAGYVLPARSAWLPLVDRTYVFGEYEARLLTGSSVYRPDEVLVTGAPRLDLFGLGRLDPAERAAIREGLGVAPGARLVVLSSTSSATVRRTVIASALDGILDRPWPNVHLVVKLHPAEDDGSFYPALIGGIARGRGFDPPPTAIVKSIDLLRLLGAADAHLGIYSTVLTDAVAVGTPNLIVTSLYGSDLLGYVEAGVAHPVRTGADVISALDAPTDPAATAAARAAFLADHFAVGPAAPRIAADLLARAERSG